MAPAFNACAIDPMYSTPLLNSPLLLVAVLLYQCVLVQMLGQCPLTGRTHRPRHTLTIAGALALAIFLAAFSTGMLQQFVLSPLQLNYLDTFGAVLCVALSTQAAIALYRRYSPSADTSPSLAAPMLLPVAAMGSVIATTQTMSIDLAAIIGRSLLAGLSFALIYVAFAALCERLLASDTPSAFRGLPIHLLTAGFIALALMGFAGVI